MKPETKGRVIGLGVGMLPVVIAAALFSVVWYAYYGTLGPVAGGSITELVGWPVLFFALWMLALAGLGVMVGQVLAER